MADIRNPLHELRNEKCQSCRDCPRFPPSPHRLVRRPHCDPGHHPNNDDCISQVVDIQLKILQTLLFLITTFPTIYGRLLASALSSCMNLGQLWYRHEGGDTAPFDHVHCRQGRRGRSPHTRLPDAKAQALRPAAHGAFAIFENGERPRFIQLEHPHKTFALELIKNVLTNYHKLFCKVTSIPSSYSYYNTTLFASILKTLSQHSAFPLSLHGTQVVFLLLKQFSSELETEAESSSHYLSNSFMTN